MPPDLRTARRDGVEPQCRRVARIERGRFVRGGRRGERVPLSASDSGGRMDGGYRPFKRLGDADAREALPRKTGGFWPRVAASRTGAADRKRADSFQSGQVAGWGVCLTSVRAWQPCVLFFRAALEQVLSR